MRDRVSRPSFIVTLATILLAAFVLVDVSPYLRGGFGWRWPFVAVETQRVWPLVIVMIIYFGIALVLMRQLRRTVPVLLWAFIGATLIPYVALSLRHSDVVYEMLVRTLSGLTTGPHLAATEINLNTETLKDWPVYMTDFVGRNVHMTTSPPGAPLFYTWLNSLLQYFPSLTKTVQQALLPYQCDNFNVLFYEPEEWTSAVFGMLMPIWAALSVFPLYTITKRLASQDMAQWAVTWWALVPGLSMFVSSQNTLFPFFSLLAFSLIVRWEQGSWKTGLLWISLAGFVTGLATFTYLGFIPIIGFFGLYVLAILLKRNGLVFSKLVRQSIAPGLCFAAGLALPWIVFWIVSGLTPADILFTSMSNHLVLDRPYLPWLWFHLQDWALFTGIPFIFLWLIGTYQALRHRQDIPFNPVGLVLLITILVIDISGTTRAETGRVWLLYSPFVLIAAAEGISQLEKPKQRTTTWILATASHIALCISMIISWNVLDSDLNPRPDPPGGLMTTIPVQANFDEVFQLISWDAYIENNTVVLRLDWQSNQQVYIPYWFSALLVDPTGTPLAESTVWQPLDAKYPTTCWMPGEWVGDTVRFPLPENPIIGDWWLSLASFANVNYPEDRATITFVDGTQDTQIGLGPITVP